MRSGCVKRMAAGDCSGAALLALRVLAVAGGDDFLDFIVGTFAVSAAIFVVVPASPSAEPDSFLSAGRSRTTSCAGLSPRPPLNAACRTLPSAVQPPLRLASITIVGLTQWVSRCRR